MAKPPIPALPEFSSKKEWTHGDETTWFRWCGDLTDWIGKYLSDDLEQNARAAHKMSQDCVWHLRMIEGHLSDDGWAKSCAVQYEHLDLLRREPDPYMCE